MAFHEIFTCTGFECGSVSVPPFKVRNHELVVLVKPDGFTQTQELMEMLGGRRATSDNCIFGRVEPIMPWKSFRGQVSVDLRETIWQNLQRCGITLRHEAEQLMTGLRTEIDDILGIAHYTDKVVLALRVARSRGADIVIAMGAGLDPVGTHAVLCELKYLQLAAIVLVGSNLIAEAEYKGEFDRRIDLHSNA